LLALTDVGPAIDELRQASLRPAARLPMAYEKGLDDVNNLMPWLAVEKSWGRVLQLRTQAELQSGQSQAGLDDAKLSLRLADTLREQPFLISHLVRIALLEISVQPIYEGIAEHRWSDAQLADLETALASEDLLSDYQRAMRGERTCGIATLESWRITGKTESVGVNGKMVTQNLGWVPSAFFLRNEIAIVQRFDRFILPMADPTNRTISLGAFRAGQSEADRLTNHWTRFGSLYTVLADMSFPSVAGSVIKFAQTQEHLDLARTACALERYRLAHGTYPEKLELAAALIDPVPHDIIDGQPLHYRRTDDGGYVLYSVGWNESDDGGAVVLTKDGRIDAKKGDWVWQLPAK
jgi:hypothetical protein